MKLKIRGTINVTVIPLLVLMGGILLFMFLGILSHNIKVETVNALETNSLYFRDVVDSSWDGDYGVVGDLLIKGGKNLVETDLLKKMKEKTGYDYTFFRGDTRVQTTIESDEGLIGTKGNPTIAKKVLEKGETVIEPVRIDNKPYYGRYEPLKNAQGTVVGMIFMGIDRTPDIQQFYRVSIGVAGITIAMVLGAVIVIGIVTNRVGRHIGEVVVQLNEMEHQDFSRAVPENLLKRHDEIGDIGRSLRVMKETVVGLLKEVEDMTVHVDQGSNVLAQSVGEMAASAQGIAVAMQEVNEGIYDQSQEMLSVTEIVNALDANMQTMGASVGRISGNVEAIYNMSRASREQVKHVVDSATGLGRAFQSYTEGLHAFEKRAMLINEITQVINTISEQTNLLALNAAIEAARAGAAGKGFSVVADEIRKLAVQSKASAGQIEGLVTNIGSDTKALSEKTVVLNEQMTDNIKTMEIIKQAFDTIHQSVQVIVPDIKCVNEKRIAVDEQRTLVLSNVAQSTCVAQSIAASSEEVAASTENMSSTTQDVATTANTLEWTVKELRETISRFKVE